MQTTNIYNELKGQNMVDKLMYIHYDEFKITPYEDSSGWNVWTLNLVNKTIKIQ